MNSQGCIRCTRVIGVLLILFLATLAHAAKNISGRSSSLSPEIQSISTQAKKCVKPGDRLNIKGVRLLPAVDVKLVVFIKSAKSLQLPVTTWTMKRVEAKLPLSNLLNPGARYPIVIVRKRDNIVISNRDKFILICRQASGASSKSSSTRSGHPETSAIPTQPQEFVRAGGDGSLIGSSLPVATYVPDIKQLQDSSYEPGELVVISKDMPSAKHLAELVKEQGYRIKRRRLLKHLGIVISVIAIPDTVTVLDAHQRLQQRDKSLLIDVNHRYNFAGQGKKNSIQDNDSLQVHKSIGWGKVSPDCGEGIKLGVLDSLVDTGHASFREHQIINKLLLPIGVEVADKQHATSIASILAGQVDSPVVGLLPAAKLYVAGVFRYSADDDRVDTTAELMVMGLDWLYGQGVHVINLSIAGPRNLFLEISIQRLVVKKVLIAAAVGNHGLENVLIYPAAIDGVTGVTAIDVRKRIYNKANRGEFVKLAAPGVDIWAARTNGKQAYVSGTSFAVPYVAASLALIRHRERNGSSQQIVRQLINKALDLGDTGKDITYGWGQLQFQGCS